MRRIAEFALLPLLLGFVAPCAKAVNIPVAAGEVAVNPSNGVCSLREAIANAEAGTDTSGGDCVAGTAGPDTVVLASGSTYDLPDVFVTDPNYGDTGLPAIATDVTVQGNGATIERSASLFSGTPCNSMSNFRIFFVDTTGALTLNSVTLKNGCADFGGTGAGGAIFNRGMTTLTGSTVENNAARFSAGAIQNDGVLDLVRSTLAGNAVTRGAGGAIVSTGTMDVLQSTLDANTTAGAGGGIFNSDPSQATIANSTLSGNLSDGTGGGVQNNGQAGITNATIALNHGTASGASPGDGAGIYLWSGTVDLANTIVAEQINGSNCWGSITGVVANLDDDGTCPSATTTASPRLGPLANNGGLTQTHALLVGSPAIDTGDNPTCAASPVNDIDQRGVKRPQFGATSLTCDIGAYEVGRTGKAPALSPFWLALLMLALSGFGVVAVRRRAVG